MKPVSSTLYHLVEEPRTPSGPKHPTIILLHGRGADEEDLLGLSSFLDGRFLILSVRAPFRFEFGSGYTWYDIGERASTDASMFGESHEKLGRFIDDVQNGYPVDPRRLYLFGFSMGSVMAYAHALTRPGQLRGVVANSGYIAEDVPISYQWNGIHTVPFFIAHGTLDPVIPVAMARRAKGLLEEADTAVDYHEYPMVHQISDESLRDASAWLAHQLDTPA